MMKFNQIKNQIINYLQENGYMSFLDIEDIFKENNFPYKGNERISLNDNPNIVMYEGWSSEALALFMMMITEGKITFGSPTDEYPFHGCGLNYPLVRQQNRKYKNPHFMYVNIYPVNKRAVI